MSLVETFPEYFFDPEKKTEFVATLRALPVPPMRKKQTLIQWCQATGVALTEDLVREVLGVDYETVH